MRCERRRKRTRIIKKHKCDGKGRDEDASHTAKACGTQTELSLPHAMRNALWSASCYQSVAEADDGEDKLMEDNEEAHSNVLDVDTLCEEKNNDSE